MFWWFVKTTYCLHELKKEVNELEIVPSRCGRHLSMWSHHFTYHPNTHQQSQELWMVFPGPTNKLLFSFSVISYVYRSFIQNKTTFTKHCLIYSVDFKTTRDIWNPMSKAVTGKFTGLAGIVNVTAPDRANSPRSRAWQIVILFNSAAV